MTYTIVYDGDDHGDLAAFLESAVSRYSTDNPWVIGLRAAVGYADKNVTEKKRDYVLVSITHGVMTLRRFDEEAGEAVGESFEFGAEDVANVHVY